MLVRLAVWNLAVAESSEWLDRASGDGELDTKMAVEVVEPKAVEPVTFSWTLDTLAEMIEVVRVADQPDHRGRTAGLDVVRGFLVVIEDALKRGAEVIVRATPPSDEERELRRAAREQLRDRARAEGAP